MNKDLYLIIDINVFIFTLSQGIKCIFFLQLNLCNVKNLLLWKCSLLKGVSSEIYKDEI